jgi:hypothetical protein
MSVLDHHTETIEAMIQHLSLKGADFLVEIEGYEKLTDLFITADPEMPGREAVEDVPGPGGAVLDEPGNPKTGGRFNIVARETIDGDIFKMVMKIADGCLDPSKRVTVKVYSAHEKKTGGIGLKYTYCWFEIDPMSFDAESKTMPIKTTIIMHFANRGTYSL